MAEFRLLGSPVPKATIPIGGRNSSTLIETAVRVFLHRRSGIDTVSKLVEGHDLLASGI
ncbi:MAG: hypothetical protein ABIU09_05665 [Pyrinomonadaceae bacterium]